VATIISVDSTAFTASTVVEQVAGEQITLQDVNAIWESAVDNDEDAAEDEVENTTLFVVSDPYPICKEYATLLVADKKYEETATVT